MEASLDPARFPNDRAASVLQIPCNTGVPLGLPWTVIRKLQCHVTFMPVTAHQPIVELFVTSRLILLFGVFI